MNAPAENITVTDSTNVMPLDCLEVLLPFEGGSVVEFGNKRNPNGLYKTWYLENGARYTSLDWNGKDGALKVDAREDLRYLGQFDLVTNFGFSEHVEGQTQFWQNNHRLCKPGGLMVGLTPFPGDWPTHGFWQPYVKFYEQLAKLNNYTVEELKVLEPDKSRHRDRRLTAYRLRKGSPDVSMFNMPHESRIMYNPGGRRKGTNGQ